MPTDDIRLRHGTSRLRVERRLPRTRHAHAIRMHFNLSTHVPTYLDTRLCDSRHMRAAGPGRGQVGTQRRVGGRCRFSIQALDHLHTREVRVEKVYLGGTHLITAQTLLLPTSYARLDQRCG